MAYPAMLRCSRSWPAVPALVYGLKAASTAAPEFRCKHNPDIGVNESAAWSDRSGVSGSDLRICEIQILSGRDT